MPLVVLKTIISYLDIGDIIPLVLVNKSLYWTLITDEHLWHFLLRERLHVKCPETDNAFNHLMLLSHAGRCCHCHRMEGFSRLPYFHPFWRMPFCNSCRSHDDYKLMTATYAKREYFLNDNDLLSFRVISKDNPHCSSASYVRRFSATAVIRKSEAKLKAQGITREQRLAKRLDRSQRETLRQSNLRQMRRDEIIGCLDFFGFPSANTHYCHAVDGFVRRTYRRLGRERREKWTSEEVVRWCFQYHLP
jgi:XPA protein C-terminus